MTQTYHPGAPKKATPKAASWNVKPMTTTPAMRIAMDRVAMARKNPSLLGKEER